MQCAPFGLIESDVRFLEYRLDVISAWPPSLRKQATAEAISRRLASVARATLFQRESGGLLSTSCRLLDTIFSGQGETPASQRAA
jgi:hypothetical protein